MQNGREAAETLSKSEGLVNTMVDTPSPPWYCRQGKGPGTLVGLPLERTLGP